jgi:hypothetical protein
MGWLWVLLADVKREQSLCEGREGQGFPIEADVRSRNGDNDPDWAASVFSANEVVESGTNSLCHFRCSSTDPIAKTELCTRHILANSSIDRRAHHRSPLGDSLS